MSSWLRFFGTLVVLFSTGVSAMAGQMEQKTNKELFRFCDYDSADFEPVEAEFVRRFPIGSEAGNLIEAVGQSTGYEVLRDKMPWPPAELGFELASYVYVYAYSCPLDHGNENYWYFIFMTDLENNITRSEFHLIFRDENFKVRGIPFRFENFSSQIEGRKALWSLTGEGTTREVVESLMRDAGIKKERVQSDKNVDQYRKHPDKESLGYQLGGYNIWVLLWEFDEGGRLRSFRIN